jgi:hypothetical protein
MTAVNLFTYLKERLYLFKFYQIIHCDELMNNSTIRI